MSFRPDRGDVQKSVAVVENPDIQNLTHSNPDMADNFSMSNDWKSVLKTQHNELKSIQKMDSINDSRVNSDIEKLLSRPNSSRNVFSAVKAAAAAAPAPPPAPTTPATSDYPPVADYESDEDPHYGDIYGSEVISPSPSKKSTKPLVQNPLATPSVAGPDPNKAPEAADR